MGAILVHQIINIDLLIGTLFFKERHPQSTSFLNDCSNHIVEPLEVFSWYLLYNRVLVCYWDSVGVGVGSMLFVNVQYTENYIPYFLQIWYWVPRPIFEGSHI